MRLVHPPLTLHRQRHFLDCLALDVDRSAAVSAGESTSDGTQQAQRQHCPAVRPLTVHGGRGVSAGLAAQHLLRALWPRPASGAVRIIQPRGALGNHEGGERLKANSHRTRSSALLFLLRVSPSTSRMASQKKLRLSSSSVAFS
uniref:Uncharacterized protein n=1 Tax=Ailuropoda melanoleuca TaxID=9646 RepID=A0A7N5P524_AILME